MRRVGAGCVLAASFVLLCGAAAAQSSPSDRPATPSSSDSQTANLRNFSLRNLAGQTIEEALATTTEGRQHKLTEDRAIRPNQSQSFQIPARDCIDSVRVRFQDGRTLSADHLQDCRLPFLVVRDDKIDVDTSAQSTNAPHFGGTSE